jgi:hypothetical protein
MLTVKVAFAAGANLYEPRGLFYLNGALYIADRGNDRVRRVASATGIITTVAGDGSPYDSGNTDGGPALANSRRKSRFFQGIRSWERNAKQKSPPG